MNKICKAKKKSKDGNYLGCNLSKNISEFRKAHNICKKCENLQSRKYRLDNVKKLKEKNKDYRKNNKDKIKKREAEYRKNNPEKIKIKKQREYNKNKKRYEEYSKQYQIENKEQIKESNRKNDKKKRENNPEFKLRKIISISIRNCLFNNGANKKGISCLKYLEYTPKELRDHIELQFKEPGNEWMTWDNHSIYNKKTWKDDDKSTWVWNLDHIIPQSKLQYSSMEEENFKKCWSLSNLRPYSAKQNLIDRDRR